VLSVFCLSGKVTIKALVAPAKAAFASWAGNEHSLDVQNQIVPRDQTCPSHRQGDWNEPHGTFWIAENDDDFEQNDCEWRKGKATKPLNRRFSLS
jgi:hypothetical protein